MSTLLITNLEDASIRYEIDGFLVVEAHPEIDGFTAAEKIDSALRRVAELLALSVEEIEHEESFDDDGVPFDDDY